MVFQELVQILIFIFNKLENTGKRHITGLYMLRRQSGSEFRSDRSLCPVPPTWPVYILYCCSGTFSRLWSHFPVEVMLRYIYRRKDPVQVRTKGRVLLSGDCAGCRSCVAGDTKKCLIPPIPSFRSLTAGEGRICEEWRQFRQGRRIMVSGLRRHRSGIDAITRIAYYRYR
jgi:hypothetical protein